MHLQLILEMPIHSTGHDVNCTFAELYKKYQQDSGLEQKGIRPINTVHVQNEVDVCIVSKSAHRIYYPYGCIF